jgi:hypothetical protein
VQYVFVIYMTIIKVSTRFEPLSLRANQRNEAMMYLSITSEDADKDYWCECDILVSPPLSLAPDKELNNGRTRIGILKPKSKIEKQIKLYTRPNNFPDAYPISITAYAYDEEGVIAERVAQDNNIMCEEDGKELQNKQGQ